MKVYNIDKTQILEDYDIGLGYLKEDTLIIHKPEIEEVEPEGHYEKVSEKELRWVVDVPGIMYQPAETITEKIYVYIPYNDEELEIKKCEDLRNLRTIECFTYINRGKLWYDKLTNEQIEELDAWYLQWLDVTITKTIPNKPQWLE